MTAQLTPLPRTERLRNIRMPHASSITFQNCVRAGWKVAAHCDACREASAPNLGPIAAGKLGDRPIRALFDARKLTCRKCGEPLAGLTVRREGGAALDSYEIVAFWREGTTCDPVVSAFWKGFREANEREGRGAPKAPL